jgi:hypothetical protein
MTTKSFPAVPRFRSTTRIQLSIGQAVMLLLLLNWTLFSQTLSASPRDSLGVVSSRHQLSPAIRSATPSINPLPTSAAQFEGSLDKVEIGSVGGWAWDASRPKEAIKVEIYDGTTLLSTITAQEFREDLKTAGKEDGKHAFNYALPPTLRDGQSHTISV